MVYEIVQVAGSMLILGAFVGALLGRISQTSYHYLALNAIGSAVLTATAVISRAWGFILLEGVWAMISIYSVACKLRGWKIAGGTSPVSADQRLAAKE